MIMHYVMVRFVLREKVYDDKLMFISMLVMVFIGISFLYLYGEGALMTTIRYTLAAAMVAVFAIINRRDIITLVNYVKKRFLGKTA